jgi:PRTRC genetic system ThiF family protein
MKPLKFLRPETGIHMLAGGLLDHRISITLAGAGGNGSQMLSGLARLHTALVKLGHPGGLHVTVFDPDNVSESNVGRQLFYSADISQPKSFVLVNRFNLAFGLDWAAEAKPFGHDKTGGANGDIVISCVDSAKSRREIHESMGKNHNKPKYWLDLGNMQRFGQAVLGQPEGSISAGSVSKTWLTDRAANSELSAKTLLNEIRLPTIIDLAPELLDKHFVEDDTPSCSLAQALERQDLFVNQFVATAALQLLWRLLREGKTTVHGAYINLDTLQVNPIPVPARCDNAPRVELRKAA